MTNPTPEYQIGDSVTVPARRMTGEIFHREYSESNESWLYSIRLDNGEMDVAIYQEKNIN